MVKAFISFAGQRRTQKGNKINGGERFKKFDGLVTMPMLSSINFAYSSGAFASGILLYPVILR